MGDRSGARDAGYQLGVVVVTYNNQDTIVALLDSLPDALDGVRARVVVVDNGSGDGTPELVRSRSDCELVESTNDGYSAGINAGVRALGNAECVLILNPDTTLHAQSVQPLLDEVTDPQVGVVAPRTVGTDGSLTLTLGRTPTAIRTLGTSRARRSWLSERLHDPSEYETRREVDWAVGAALLVTLPCHNAVGGWDESYFLYSEEVDFCLAARDRGFITVYQPASTVVHHEGGSGVRPDTHALQAVNRVRLYRRRHHLVASSIYLVFAALQELKWGVRGAEGSWRAIRALLVPSTRPPVLGAQTHWVPQ